MKKFIISSDPLKLAVKKLGQAVNEKSVLPALKNIYCKVGKNEVEFFTTDQELTIGYKCEAETGGQEPFELLIPFGYLKDILRDMRSVPVTFEHPSTRKLKIVADADEFEQNSLDKLDDFVKLPGFPKKFMMQLEEGFADKLSLALLTCGEDETNKPALTRALLDINNGSSCIVGADGNYLFRYNLKLAAEEEQQIQFSHKMIKAIEGMEKPEINITAKNVCIHDGKLTVWGTRFEDKYPNYKSIIPDYPVTMKVEKGTLASVLRKACISTNTTKQIVLELKKEIGFVSYEADDNDMSRKIHGKFAADYSGKIDNISFNAGKMLTLLDQLVANDVRLHIHAADKAILISSEQDKDYLGFIMPLKINN